MGNKKTYTWQELADHPEKKFRTEKFPSMCYIKWEIWPDGDYHLALCIEDFDDDGNLSAAIMNFSCALPNWKAIWVEA